MLEQRQEEPEQPWPLGAAAAAAGFVTAGSAADSVAATKD